MFFQKHHLTRPKILNQCFTWHGQKPLTTTTAKPTNKTEQKTSQMTIRLTRECIVFIQVGKHSPCRHCPISMCMWEAIWDAGHICPFKTRPFTYLTTRYDKELLKEFWEIKKHNRTPKIKCKIIRIYRSYNPNGKRCLLFKWEIWNCNIQRRQLFKQKNWNNKHLLTQK